SAARASTCSIACSRPQSSRSSVSKPGCGRSRTRAAGSRACRSPRRSGRSSRERALADDALLFEMGGAAGNDRLAAAEEEHAHRFGQGAGGRQNRARPIKVGPEFRILRAHRAPELKRMIRDVEQDAAAVAVEMRVLAAIGGRDLRALEV